MQSKQITQKIKLVIKSMNEASQIKTPLNLTILLKTPGSLRKNHVGISSNLESALLEIGVFTRTKCQPSNRK